MAKAMADNNLEDISVDLYPPLPLVTMLKQELVADKDNIPHADLSKITPAGWVNLVLSEYQMSKT